MSHTVNNTYVPGVGTHVTLLLFCPIQQVKYPVVYVFVNQQR